MIYLITIGRKVLRQSKIKNKLRRIDPDHEILKGVIKVLLFVLGLVAMTLGITRCRGEWLIIAFAFSFIQFLLSNVEGW